MDRLLSPLGADLAYDESVEEAARHLARRWEEFAEGKRPGRLDAKGTLARDRQTGRFVGILEQVVGGRQAGDLVATDVVAAG